MSDGFLYEFVDFLAERRITWPRATVYRPLTRWARVLAYFGIYRDLQ